MYIPWGSIAIHYQILGNPVYLIYYFRSASSKSGSTPNYIRRLNESTEIPI